MFSDPLLGPGPGASGAHTWGGNYGQGEGMRAKITKPSSVEPFLGREFLTPVGKDHAQTFDRLIRLHPVYNV